MDVGGGTQCSGQRPRYIGLLVQAGPGGRGPWVGNGEWPEGFGQGLGVADDEESRLQVPPTKRPALWMRLDLGDGWRDLCRMT